MTDFSFIRLLPNFYDAKFQETSQGASLLENYEQIIISPTGVCLQKSNNPQGISFDGLVKVSFVDLCGNEIQDITINTAITEVIDANGIPQIYFEIINTEIDHYSQPLCLKFKSTVSDNVWYSNPILVTDSITTTNFQYKNFGDLFYQSIQLATYFDVFNATSNSESYTSFDGIKRTSRLINTEFRKYKFDYCTNFTYRRLNALLGSNVIYANGFLVTDKQTIESEERQGDTDWFSVEFSLATDFTQTKAVEFQIFETFNYTSFSPIFANVLPQQELKGTLNKPFTLQSGVIRLFKNGNLIGTFNESNVVVSGLDFTIDIADIVDGVAVYAVQITSGLFKSLQGENSPFVNDWIFEIVEPEFNGTEFSNEFLIN